VEFPRFQDGFTVGLVFTALVVAAGWASVRLRRRSQRPWGLTGPAWVAASLITLGGWMGYEGVDVIPFGLLWGLLALFVAGEIAERTPNPKIIGFVLALPGAVLVGYSTEFPGPSWSRWVVLGVTALGAPLAADLDRRAARLGLGPVLWLIAVAGVYWTVPDTERVRPLIGAAIPLAFTGWPKRLSRMGAGGISASVGLLMWVAAIEGRGRPGSIVGAAGSLGLFVVEPIGRSLAKGRVAAISRSVGVGVYEACLVGAQFLTVGYASRVAGMAETGGEAFVLLVPAIPVAIVLGGLVRASSRLRPGSGGSGPRRRRTSAPTAAPRRSNQSRTLSAER
jgi:hypothetical protein